MCIMYITIYVVMVGTRDNDFVQDQPSDGGGEGGISILIL